MGSNKVLRFALVFLLLGLTGLQEVSAQTWAEFFKQKKTQKKYLLNQIAAFQVYLGYARKGYELVGNGLETIRDISSGEFGLHDAFISSLRQVSPLVSRDARVAEIIGMQVSVLRLLSGTGSADLLSAGDRRYIAGVKSALRSKCLEELDALFMVVTAGQIEMGEKERLRRIGELYVSMNGHYGFARRFSAEVSSLVRQREMELSDLKWMGGHYGAD